MKLKFLEHRMIKMKFGLFLIMLAFASENQENKVEIAKSEEKDTEISTENVILVKIEEDDYTKERVTKNFRYHKFHKNILKIKYLRKKNSKYFGVSYNKLAELWLVQRWSKSEVRVVYNGYYKNEETAAHASDTLARKLMDNGKQNPKLNFPEDHTEVFPEVTDK